MQPPLNEISIATSVLDLGVCYFFRSTAWHIRDSFVLDLASKVYHYLVPEHFVYLFFCQLWSVTFFL